MKIEPVKCSRVPQSCLPVKLNPSKFPTYLDFKEVASTLTVTGRQNRCVDVEKILLLEEFVNGHCGSVPDSEETGEAVGPRSQVWKLTDVLQSMMLASFEWILLCINRTIIIN